MVVGLKNLDRFLKVRKIRFLQPTQEDFREGWLVEALNARVQNGYGMAWVKACGQRPLALLSPYTYILLYK